MLKEFKAFVMRGNVLDLAVAVIVGGVFGKIVSSLVNDVLMPPIGLLIGDVDFKNLFVVLKEGTTEHGPYASLDAAKHAGAITLNLGVFLNTLINFLIIAWAMFLVVKLINRLRRQQAAAPAAPPRTETLLEEIRDELKKRP
jgi:large conductance mechanosensitive channel